MVRVVALLFSAFCVALSGCAHVAPWQRETLASRPMAIDDDPDESALVSSRRRTREEGHIGGSGSGGTGSGGGCGCN